MLCLFNMFEKWYNDIWLNFIECKVGCFGKFCNIFCFFGRFGEKCGGICFLECFVEKCDFVRGCYYMIKIFIDIILLGKSFKKE